MADLSPIAPGAEPQNAADVAIALRAATDLLAAVERTGLTARFDAGPAARLHAVQRVMAQRAARDRFVPARLLGEPGWDILLDLYASDLAGRPVSISSAAMASRLPLTTGLRWIGNLVDHGLASRAGHPHDRRSTYLHLTELGRERMNRWADDWLTRTSAPAPRSP